MLTHVIVSIPFKREGTFRHFGLNLMLRKVEKFQFPSNGKAHSDGHEGRRGTERRYWFQFPSNGKAHSDSASDLSGIAVDRVSIPFKREGTFRHALLRVLLVPYPSVSIPFKREGTFRLIARFNQLLCCSFQFPSNGKAHSDPRGCWSLRVRDHSFQFPSNGKAHSDASGNQFC